MDVQEVIDLVDKILKEAKEETRFARDAILAGQLTELEYRNRTGFLQGAESVCEIVKFIGNKQIGDIENGR